MKSTFNRSGSRLLAGAATIAMASVALSTPAHAIVPNDNTTPAQAVDTQEQFKGVGMFFRSDGFVCTGTLINPRTVLFAAHCVNDRAATDFNVNNVPAAFSFNVNALPGFQNWTANRFASNPSLAVFNINRIFYDPRSLQRPDSRGFLEADIAIASLDTPAAKIPTWSLLFSPLPAPSSISATNGTGYHVNITGYGRSGSGTTGASQGIDWRRRAAENMIGALTSFDARNTFLFGAPFGNLPQVLYRLDFDDPNKANPFDFNLYKDEARQREGTTAGGDSGGPLILDAANNPITKEDLVIGVLSGGSRFFGPQVFSSYGTESFYQPLYLFWDWIAANNPYRYVSAKAGDGNWEDASRWVTTLDPNYRIINASGAIVNGVPTSPGAGITGTAPQWGEVCFDPRGNNPGDGCQNLANGNATPPARNIDGSINSGIGEVGKDALGAVGGGDSAVADASAGRGALGREGLINSHEAQGGGGGVAFAQETPHGSSGGTPEFSGSPLPAPTLANGLPGASNFVPNNINPVVSSNPATNVNPRYFDVTLRNAGTTTLSSTVTIDRLTLLSTAGLNIASTGRLNSLIDVSQFGGTMTVNGALTSVGDYTLFGGALQGSGTITAPFVTNIMGAISPGTIGGISTLGINGSLVLASGSTLMIDIGPNGASDRVAVNGQASAGGVVAVGSGVTGIVNGNGQRYTILTATGGVTGTFTAGTLSPILRQSFSYTPTSVLMQIVAASYGTVIDPQNAVQSSYAKLWDQNRSNAALAGHYALDFASTATIRSTFDGLAPVGETAVQQLAAQSFNSMQSFNASRLRVANLANSGGTIATLGNPIETAHLQVSRGSQPIFGGTLGLDQGEQPTSVEEGALREDVGIFIAGGMLQGRGESMPGYTGSGKTDVDGYFFAGGIEYFPSDNSMVGLSGYYSDLDADTVLGQRAEARMLAVSLYGRYESEDNVVVDGQVSLTDLDVDTTRTVGFLGGTQTLTSDSSSGGFMASVGVSYDIDGAFGTISPGVEARYINHSFDPVSETGGSLALTIDRKKYESAQGRAGIDYSKSTGLLQIDANLDLVHEFNDSTQLFSAQFANGVGPGVAFALAGNDSTWGEFGLSAQFGEGPVKFGVGFDTTIGRDNADAQSYRATASFKF